MAKGAWGRLACGLLAAALAAGCQARDERQASFRREIPWADDGIWLRADTHVHTRFSDGDRSVLEVAEQADRFGCDVLAVTDHADTELEAATTEYFADIETARERFPQMVILAGLEWNIPPWDGKEHMTVLVAPGADEAPTLRQLKRDHDDWKRAPEERPDAATALRWLARETADDPAPAAILYNHPSRLDADNLENVLDMQMWRKVNDLVIGFSGAPGHQRYGERPLGDYRYGEALMDRWDPVVAEVGGAWDLLLKHGIDVWGALAPSDFHSRESPHFNDYWPCEFSETWLFAPERSAAGALRALRAGSFFAAHGHIVRELVISVQAEGLPRFAIAGESIQVLSGTDLAVRIQFQTPARDWRGAANQIDEIELIGVTAEGATVVAARPPTAGPVAFQETLQAPGGGVILRARGRRAVEGEPALMFYSNPIRVTIRD